MYIYYLYSIILTNFVFLKKNQFYTRMKPFRTILPFLGLLHSEPSCRRVEHLYILRPIRGQKRVLSTPDVIIASHFYRGAKLATFNLLEVSSCDFSPICVNTQCGGRAMGR